MDKLKIVGCRALNGEITISGSKNAALSLLASSILSKTKITLNNVPNIQDVISMLSLLRALGSNISFEHHTVSIDNFNINKTTADYDYVKKMRASVLLLGSLIGRFHEAKVSLPGGCAIGVRAVDQHIEGIKALGVDIDIENGYIVAKVSKAGLKGCNYTFKHNSVGATENVITCAVLAEGTTILNNCAKEPEIISLCEFLNKLGAKISGYGTNTITIEGVKELNSSTSFYIPEDRIEAGTYAIATAITDGEVLLKNCSIRTFENVIDTFENIGIGLEAINKDISCVKAFKLHDFKPFNIETAIYPGFPTDLQAQIMIPLLMANGKSIITENIFENRFMHCAELCRMGAKIEVNGKQAIIYGGQQLKGANVMATDLRASASLVLAGLIAKGETIIDRVYHLYRGYENLSQKLNSCGASLEIM